MPTPHNNAKKGDFARVCIMPGDPLRAKWIAETFLEKVKLVNDVRGMFAFTGYYKGKRVSVMGHGMGTPSIGIYATELYKFYDVDYIIRVGTGGALVKQIHVGSVFLGEEAYSESNLLKEIGVKTKNNIYKPSKKLLDLAIKTCKELKIPYNIGCIANSDCFYHNVPLDKLAKKMGNAKICEMESAGLYGIAKWLKKDAFSLLTCSDSLVTKEETTAHERQTTFKNMMKIALEMAIKLTKK